MSISTWRFDPLDTLFFREARPHGSAGGSELASLFPPPARTVAGAIRTFIGESQGVNWAEFGSDADHPLRRRIGYGDDLGPLRVSGPWLTCQGQRLYPAPLFLLSAGEGEHRKLVRLRIGMPVECDLGKVRLPELPSDCASARILESMWLNERTMSTVLAGGTPRVEDLVPKEALYAEEPRLGIARVQARRTAEEGKLYQTRHIRPKSDVAIEVDVAGGGNAGEIKGGMVRFGGEGRLAAVSVNGAGGHFPQPPIADETTTGLILVLLTPALFGADRWLPAGFAYDEQNGVRVWRGEIAGVRLTLHAAVIGRARREGGWDLAKNGPRAVRSQVPAGSAYYCTVDAGSLVETIARLHGQHVGNDAAFGHGQIACGLWNQNEFSV